MFVNPNDTFGSYSGDKKRSKPLRYMYYTVDHAESCRRARQISLITVVVVFDTVPEARKHANSL